MKRSDPNYIKEYRKNNREKWNRTPEQQDKVNERRRQRYKEDESYRNQQKQLVKEFRIKNPNAKKNQDLKKYGMTIDDLNAMLHAQNGQCAICGYSDITNKFFFPMVDHCHDKGHVRGLLCSNCNMGIGKFKDNPELLIRAARYLTERGKL